LEDAVPFFEIDRAGVPCRDADVVVQDIEPTVPLDSERCHGVHSIGLRYVGWEGGGVATFGSYLLLQGFCPILAAVDQDNLCTLSREQDGSSRTISHTFAVRYGTCDDRDFA
jgi:hypothetical protein